MHFLIENFQAQAVVQFYRSRSLLVLMVLTLMGCIIDRTKCLSLRIKMYGSLDDDNEYYKTSFSVFVAILYLKVLYILVMTLYILSRFNQTLLFTLAVILFCFQ